MITRTYSSGGSALRVPQRLSLLLFIVVLGFPGAANALLITRGPNLVYDTVLDITWVRDAHLCVTLNNCVNRNDGLVAGGMSWDDANTWAANLVYQGFDDWRLPYASVAAGAGPSATVHFCTGAGGADVVACRDNEMGYMFYYNLDGNLGDNKTGNQTAVSGEMLTDIQFFHWSATEVNSVDAWSFTFGFGSQASGAGRFEPFSAWAVREGDVGVAAVSEPMSLLLVIAGVLGLALARRGA